MESKGSSMYPTSMDVMRESLPPMFSMRRATWEPEGSAQMRALLMTSCSVFIADVVTEIV